MTRRVATLVAICLACQPAWGHSFPPVRTVVVQIENDGIALLVGYRPGSGAASDNIIARAASQPKSRVMDTLRDVMEAYALAPIAVTIDGKPLVPTSVRAKLDFEGNASKPMVIVLVTYASPPAGKLAVISKDPRTTRFSWQDRSGCRVDIDRSPSQDRWFTGVASFLLELAGPCVSSRSASSH
jgi:hypothetical protein